MHCSIIHPHCGLRSAFGHFLSKSPHYVCIKEEKPHCPGDKTGSAGGARQLGLVGLMDPHPPHHCRLPLRAEATGPVHCPTASTQASTASRPAGQPVALSAAWPDVGWQCGCLLPSFLGSHPFATVVFGFWGGFYFEPNQNEN